MTVTDLHPSAPTREVPSSLLAEEDVLSGMLLFKSTMQALIDMGLSAQDFYHPAHGHVFAAAAELHAEGELATVVTVGERLRMRGMLDLVGGDIRWLVGLRNDSPTTETVLASARLVRTLAGRRRRTEWAHEILTDAYAIDIEPEDFEGHVMRSYGEKVGTDDHTAEYGTDVLHDVLDHLEELQANGGQVGGVKSGYVDLDKIIGSFKPATVTVVGARTSVGKTSFASWTAASAAMAGVPTAFFSFEMKRTEVMQRILQQVGRIDMAKFDDPATTPEQWDGIFEKVSRATGKLNGIPLWIDDMRKPTMARIAAQARRLHRQHGLGLIVIDYVQRIRPQGRAESETAAMSAISWELSDLAVELDVPLVVLAQLNRGAEQGRGGKGGKATTEKRPVLSHLKQSGSLEEDAHMVILISRDTADKDGIAEVEVAKNRSGPTGMVRMSFLQRYALFACMAKDEEARPEPTYVFTEPPAPPPPPAEPGFAPEQDEFDYDDSEF